MKWSSSDLITTIVERERPLLDEIFGAGQYEIEDTGPDSATIRSSEFRVRVGYARNRDRDLRIDVMLLGLPEPVSVRVHPLQTWARYLDEDYPLPPRDAQGFVTIPPDEQLRNELNLFARYKRELFSDPQTKRDAAFFAAGYNRAYNDMYSRKGAWSEDS